MTKDVDGTCVAAARYDDQPAILYMADDRLIVPNPCVRLPAVVRVRELQREALLEVRHTLDLPGHQDHTIDQERWSTFLDDADALAVEVVVVGWRHVDLDAGWELNLSVAPDIRVQDQRHVVPTDAPEHSF